MTYGVPYSFVPGTKARADEMNANFIDVLDKIGSSNSRITTLESEKANNTDVDGTWTSSSKQILTDTSVNGSTNLTFSISNYLPDDGNIYEVMVFAIGTSSSTSGQSNACYLSTDVIHAHTCMYRITPRTNAPVYGGGSAILVVGTNRQITLTRNSSYYGTVSVYLVGYRKVR